MMANLALSPTRKYFGFGDKDDYVVLDGGRVIGRKFLHPQGPESVVMDDNCSRHSAINRQAWIFGNARTSDGGFSKRDG